jgi:hypothetical protein
MQLREADRFPGLVPEPAEVGPAQRTAERPDEYQAAVLLGLAEVIADPVRGVVAEPDLARLGVGPVFDSRRPLSSH